MVITSFLLGLLQPWSVRKLHSVSGSTPWSSRRPLTSNARSALRFESLALSLSSKRPTCAKIGGCHPKAVYKS